MVGGGWSGRGSNSSSCVVSGGIGVSIQEQFESSGRISSAQVLDENIFEILNRHGVITVRVIGNHEFKSFISVSWMVNIQRTVEVRDHLSGFHGVHVSTSIGIIFAENFSGKNSSRVFVKSSFIVSGNTSSGSNSGGWSGSVSSGDSRSSNWLRSVSSGSSSSWGGCVSSGDSRGSDRGSLGSSDSGGWSLGGGVGSSHWLGSGCLHFSFRILYLN